MCRVMRDTGSASLSGKTAVVTGGAGGIGAALAQRLVAEGAQVVLLDLDADGLTRVASQLPPDRVKTIRCDLTDPDDCARAIEEAGAVDILINNGGITHRSLLVDTDLAVLRKVMDVNFFGAVHCTQSALRTIIERRGMIVAISSVAGFAPLVGRCGYAASKHALHGFFDSLRSEVEHLGVGVLLVCPSYTRTAIDAHALSGDGGAAGLSKSTIGKTAEPSAVADEVVQAILRRKRRLVLSPVGKAAWWVSKLLPDVYARIMFRAQMPEFEGRNA